MYQVMCNLLGLVHKSFKGKALGALKESKPSSLQPKDADEDLYRKVKNVVYIYVEEIMFMRCKASTLDLCTNACMCMKP